MVSDLGSWRAAVGLFYNCIQGTSVTYTFKVYPLKNIHTKSVYFGNYIIILLTNIVLSILLGVTAIQTCIACMTLVNICICFSQHNKHSYINDIGLAQSPNSKTNMLNLDYYLFLIKLILLSGDIQTNPGPTTEDTTCLSIMHQNIRSIRNKIRIC